MNIKTNMTNNNWEEEFDEKFGFIYDSGRNDGDSLIDYDYRSLKAFISNLLLKKDQEHKAEIKDAISIIDNIMNKLN